MAQDKRMMCLSKCNSGYSMTAAKSKAELTLAANAKIAAGGLMTLSEVAALLDLATSTVHALPIESIRMGRSLRFDPYAVINYINSCREPAAVQG